MSVLFPEVNFSLSVLFFVEICHLHVLNLTLLHLCIRCQIVITHANECACICTLTHTHTHSRDANFYISASSVTHSYLKDTCVICTMNNTQNVMVECIGRLQVQTLVWRPAIRTDFQLFFFPPSPHHNRFREDTSN